MAFQSGVTTSPNDLLDKMRLFATGSCSYTQLMYQQDAGFFRLHLQHAATNQFVHLHSYGNRIEYYGATSFNGDVAYNAQTVASGSFYVNPLSGSAEYFLFGGDGWCYCVVQTASTAYWPIIFGAITKTCTFTGGAFVSDNYTTWVRADIDGATNKWHSMQPDNSWNDVSRVRAFYWSTTRGLDGYSPIAFNGVTPLYPVTVDVGRLPTPRDVFCCLGFAPGVKILRMAGQYVDKDIVTLGSSQWMVFTMLRSNNVGGGGLGFLK